MRMRMIVPACVFAMAAAQAHASDLRTPLSRPVEVSSGAWTFAITPYAWAAGLSGDVGSFGLPTVHVEPKFRDILDNLDFAFMAAGEARYGRFSLFGDVIYTKLSLDIDAPRDILADRVEVGSETFAGLLGAGYALLDDPRGRLDLVAGAKVWSVSTSLSFSGQLLNGRAADDSATWVDGMVGLRGRYDLTDKLYLTSWGLVGGGGARIDWDVAAGIGYAFSDRISAIVGYRALGVDYRDGGYVFDAVQQGPILGVSLRF